MTQHVLLAETLVKAFVMSSSFIIQFQTHSNIDVKAHQ